MPPRATPRGKRALRDGRSAFKTWHPAGSAHPATAGTPRRSERHGSPRGTAPPAPPFQPPPAPPATPAPLCPPFPALPPLPAALRAVPAALTLPAAAVRHPARQLRAGPELAHVCSGTPRRRAAVSGRPGARGAVGRRLPGPPAGRGRSTSLGPPSASSKAPSAAGGARGRAAPPSGGGGEAGLWPPRSGRARGRCVGVSKCRWGGAAGMRGAAEGCAPSSPSAVFSTDASPSHGRALRVENRGFRLRGVYLLIPLP